MLKGFNSCCFAYGQTGALPLLPIRPALRLRVRATSGTETSARPLATPRLAGSGKTYTIFGESGEERGIVPRALEFMFAELERRQRLIGATMRSSMYVR